ncbi:hypothetical protein BDP27DRAFT_942136 [Rhodocollybia butyracea]|uniref:Uncharacterized protein n=1 Tax=Rhodocollybia butyracea TaxID=206335 RepID=A0A9P5PJT9_9AGAR|nr:hypothetical protein BDP27DRAFT_942136 [Rhodocollybia butyracea]
MNRPVGGLIRGRRLLYSYEGLLPPFTVNEILRHHHYLANHPHLRLAGSEATAPQVEGTGQYSRGNPVLSDTSGWVERDKHRSPSPPPPPPPALTMPSRGYGLPPKPVMPLIRSPTPDFERRTGGGGPGNNDRGRADWPRNRRSASPVDNRAQGQRQRRLSEAQFSAPERDRDRDRGRNDPPFSAAPPRRHIATEDMDIDDGPPLHRNDRNNRANEKRDGNGYDRLDHSDRPPPMRRGGSLLDRLSMGSPQNDRPPPSNNNPPPTSLRDRVQIPAKRGREDAVWEERPGQSNGFNGDVDMDDGNVGSKRRRRAQKPRRGRGGGRG